MMLPRFARLAGAALLLASAAVATSLLFDAAVGTVTSADQGAGATVRYVPADLRDTSWLDVRGAAQIKAAASEKVFHDFQFADRLAESGITFTHRTLEDAGRAYKAVHYDHGNGLSIADVDGD